MTAKELFDAGKVREATSSLAAVLRDHPTDRKSRTFLFELLCFAGDYDRAEKHLNLLAEGSKENQLGAALYISALQAERSRHDLFRKQEFPKVPAPSPKGQLNGKGFESISDSDPQIGACLEVYASGAYLWIPFQQISSIRIQTAQRLRDTLWTPAFVLTSSAFQGPEIGEVLIPALYPFSWNSQDESVWLGRTSEWVADEDGNEFPVGHKVFIVDGEEIPFPAIQTVEFALDAAAEA